LTNAGPLKLKRRLVGGNLTSEDVFNLVPDLADVVVLFDVPAKVIWSMLTHSVSSLDGCTHDRSTNTVSLHASDSLYFEWEDVVDVLDTLHTTPTPSTVRCVDGLGPKLRVVKVNGAKLEQDGMQNYTIATNSYIASYNFTYGLEQTLVSLASSSNEPIVVADTGLSEYDAVVNFVERYSSGSHAVAVPVGWGAARAVQTRAFAVPIGVYCQDPQSGVEDCAHMYHMIDALNDKHDGFLDNLLATDAAAAAAEAYNKANQATAGHSRARLGYIRLVANREHVYVGCSAGKAHEAWKQMHAIVPFPLAVFGIPCSDEIGELSKIDWREANNDSSVVFSQSSTATKLADAEEFPLVVRLSSPESIMSSALYKLCVTFGWNRVAIVHDNSVWGTGAAADFVNEAKTADPWFAAITISELNKSYVSAVTRGAIL
jgi:hypothetical protein